MLSFKKLVFNIVIWIYIGLLVGYYIDMDISMLIMNF